MTNSTLINFIWNAIVTGMIGNAAYEGIRAILGKDFDSLLRFSKGKQKPEFEATLISILARDEKIEQQLSQLQQDLNNGQSQNHSGIGDNVGRDKTVNYIISAPSQIAKYNLTDKQKDALIKLVEIGKTWQQEFTITWHENGISDIVDYDGTPPQISKGDIRILQKEKLLSCEFDISSIMQRLLLPQNPIEQ